MAALINIAGCAPVFVTKSYSEQYTDPTTGHKIIYTESITQQPETRTPIHLQHTDLYK